MRDTTFGDFAVLREDDQRIPGADHRHRAAGEPPPHRRGRAARCPSLLVLQRANRLAVQKRSWRDFQPDHAVLVAVDGERLRDLDPQRRPGEGRRGQVGGAQHRLDVHKAADLRGELVIPHAHDDAHVRVQIAGAHGHFQIHMIVRRADDQRVGVAESGRVQRGWPAAHRRSPAARSVGSVRRLFPGRCCCQSRPPQSPSATRARITRVPRWPTPSTIT